MNLPLSTNPRPANPVSIPFDPQHPIATIEFEEVGRYHTYRHRVEYDSNRRQVGSSVMGFFHPIEIPPGSLPSTIAQRTWQESGIQIDRNNHTMTLTRPGVYRINGQYYAVGEDAQARLNGGNVDFPPYTAPYRITRADLEKLRLNPQNSIFPGANNPSALTKTTNRQEVVPGAPEPEIARLNRQLTNDFQWVAYNMGRGLQQQQIDAGKGQPRINSSGFLDTKQLPQAISALEKINSGSDPASLTNQEKLALNSVGIMFRPNYVGSQTPNPILYNPRMRSTAISFLKELDAGKNQRGSIFDSMRYGAADNNHPSLSIGDLCAFANPDQNASKDSLEISGKQISRAEYLKAVAQRLVKR